MTYEGKKVEKKKTVIHQKTLNPVFNETFTFSVPYERIRHTSLVISVMDHDRHHVTAPDHVTRPDVMDHDPSRDNHEGNVTVFNVMDHDTLIA